jgi:hypothetical protein
MLAMLLAALPHAASESEGGSEAPPELLAEGLCEAVTDTEAERLAGGDAESHALSDGVRVGEGEEEGLAEVRRLPEGEAVRLGECEAEGLEVTERLREGETEPLPLPQAVALTLGDRLPLPHTVAVGDAEALCEALRREARVAVVPGAARWFGPGAEGHLRVCLATSEGILTEGLHRVTTYLERLGGGEGRR